MQSTVAEIAALVGGTAIGDRETPITGVSSLADAAAGDLSFMRDARYRAELAATGASAVLVAAEEAACAPVQIVVPNPDMALAQVIQNNDLGQVGHPAGIHESAVLGQDVQLGEKVAIDALVRIADGTVIGDRCVIYAGAYIGKHVSIGPDTVIYPNAVLREDTEVGARCVIHAGAVLGSDGFGFVPMDGAWVKIPQVGRVILGDDVEVGAHSAVDRATFGVTRIGRGTKIDNLVQVGHNVQMGEHVVIAGMVGIAGSASIGNHVSIGATAGVGGHLTIGDGAQVGGRAGVNKSVPPGAIVSGFPAVDHGLSRRILAAQRHTPGLLRRVRQLERQIEALKEQQHEQATDDS